MPSLGVGVIHPEGFLEKEGKGIRASGRNPIVRRGESCSRAGMAAGQLPPGRGKTPQKHSQRICAAGAEPNTFLGSAGGGWRADLPWMLCPGPLPETTFL